MTNPKDFMLNEADEVKYFAPKTWFFWRSIIACFCIFSLVGHWLEIPYCNFMDAAFNVVSEDYDVWTDPLWVPYWVYGIGSVAITLTLFPLKIHILEQRKTIIAAAVQFFVIAVAVSAVLELVLGLIVNQPDATGTYPYWDNSVLPLNIFNQAWLVNDIVLGAVSLIYVFVIFPFIQKMFSLVKPHTAEVIFTMILVFFALCCFLAYAVPYIPEAASFLLNLRF